MSTIVIDAAMRERFLAAGGVAEVRDESGELVGKFYRSGPPAPPAGYVIEGEWPSDEEIDRRLREERSYTPEEVMERLRGLRDAR